MRTIKENTTIVIEKGANIKSVQLGLNTDDISVHFLCDICNTEDRLGFILRDEQDRIYANSLWKSSEEYKTCYTVFVYPIINGEKYQVSVSEMDGDLIISLTHIHVAES